MFYTAGLGLEECGTVRLVEKMVMIAYTIARRGQQQLVADLRSRYCQNKIPKIVWSNVSKGIELGAFAKMSV